MTGVSTPQPVRGREDGPDLRSDLPGERSDRWFVGLVVFVACSPTYIPNYVPNLVLVALLLAWMVVRAVRRRQTYWDLPTLPVALLLLLAGLSMAWAWNATAAADSVLGLYAYSLLALYCASALPPRVLIDGFLLGMKLFLGASILAYVLLPSIAIFEPGSFQGLAYHRNYMGYIAALSAITFTWVIVYGGRRTKTTIAWWMVSVGCLVATASVTSMSLFAMWLPLLVAVGWLSARPSVRTVGLLTLFTVCSVGALVLYINLPTFTHAVGRDPTLTGRTDIWRIVVQLIGSHPWFGHGVDVWSPGHPVGESIRSALNFGVSHAHNGYLHVALQLGIAGSFLMVWILLLLLSRSLARIPSGATYLWMFVVVGMIASFNMVENRVLLNLGWFLIVAVGSYVSSRRSVPAPVGADRLPASPQHAERQHAHPPGRTGIE